MTVTRVNGMTFKEFVRRERKVTVRWNPSADVMELRIERRDGTFRALAATALQLAQFRTGPVDLFRSMVSDPLDKAAIRFLAELGGAEGLMRFGDLARATPPPIANVGPAGPALAPPSSRVPMYRPR